MNGNHSDTLSFTCSWWISKGKSNRMKARGMVCQIHFWDAFINGHFDDVIVMNHKYEASFRKPWMMNFHILTQSLVDIVIPTQKISFPKMFDFHGNSHTAYVSLNHSTWTDWGRGKLYFLYRLIIHVIRSKAFSGIKLL